jgi:tRNA(Arg) A34 adenosine deaminase TadA
MAPLVAANTVTSTPPTARRIAEMALIRAAQNPICRIRSLRGANTCAGEPCAMCAGALFWVGVGRIVHAASQVDH